VQVSLLLRSIDRGLEGATRRLGADGEWLDVIQALESARAVVKGSGPGGDL
jgi:hypothetical protein